MQTAPPNGIPTIISRVLDIDYEHKICTQAFPPGKYYQVPPLPNVTAVNALGGFNIAADRLAFIDGEGTLVLFIAHIYPAMLTAHGSPVDPWRPYTPHSNYGGAMKRDDTLSRPFKIIPGAFRALLLVIPFFCLKYVLQVASTTGTKMDL
jgi:hypothetical protein